MKKLGLFVLFLACHLMVLGLVYKNNLLTQYLANDDFEFWSTAPDIDSRSTFYYSLALLGRPIASYIFSVAKDNIHNFQDLTYIRLISVFLIALCASGISVWLFTYLRIDPFLSFSIGSGLSLLPGLQTLIIWVDSLPFFFGLLLILLAGVLVVNGRSFETLGTTFKQNTLRYSLCALLIITTLLIYQPTSSIFFLIPMLYLLFSREEEQKTLLIKSVSAAIVFCLAAVFYFGLIRWIILPYYKFRYSTALEYFQSFVPHKFETASYGLLFEKIFLFINELTPRALDLYLAGYSYNSRISVSIFLLIILGVAAAIASNLGPHARYSTAGKFLKSRIHLGGLILLLCLLSNTSFFAGRNSVMESRTTIGYSGILISIAIWSVCEISRYIWRAKATIMTRIIIGAFILSLALTAEANLTRCAMIFSTELRYIESKLIPSAHTGMKIHFIIPWQSGNDMTTFTTLREEAIPRIVHAVLANNGMSHIKPHTITSGRAIDPYEHASDLLIIDMNIPAQSVYDPIAPPVVTTRLLAKNLLGMDIVSVYSPILKERFFGVTTDEVKEGEIACAPKGCSKVFYGPNRESIVQQIRMGERISILDSHVGINNNSFLSKSESRILLDPPFWHSYPGSTLPVWIQMEFDNVKAAQRLSIQSPPDNNASSHLQMPKDFTLKGSHDGAYWQDLLNVQNAIFSEGGQWQKWDFTNPTAFKFYKLLITANNGDAKQITIQDLRLETK